MPHLYESKFIPKLEKKGNKVTSISTRVGIVFRDVVKLLAPSTNLRSFGKLFDLEQAKAHFPFGLLTSVNVLKRSGLPENPEDWKSELTGGPAITVEDIQEAKALYVDAECQNLGDYLAAYLKLDVDILYLATQKWRQQLKELVDIDFVESRKFTISSLSYLAGTKCAVRNRQIGSFFPNISQMYRLLRLGMRG